MYTESLKAKVKKLSREELECLAVSAMFHLRCVSSSRNSFHPDYQDAVHRAGIRAPLRDGAVEAMHQRAVAFLSIEDA